MCKVNTICEKCGEEKAVVVLECGHWICSQCLLGCYNKEE
jgi:hypothetical protein